MTAQAPAVDVPANLAPRLPLRRIATLGGVDYGVNLFWHSLELQMLFFYVEIVGISPIFAGLVLTLGSLCDALVDPLIGSLADRTRTRWGRFRPWVVLGSPFVAVGLAACFYKPALSGAALAAYVLLAHLLFRATYTATTIPYIALSARVVRDTRDRSLLSGFRMQFGGLASLTVALGYPTMVDMMGGSSDADARGYFLAAVIVGLLAIPVLGLTMRAVREPEDSERKPQRRAPGTALREDASAFIRMLRHNGSLVRVLIAIVMLSTAGTLISKMTLFYYKYVAGEPELGRYALAISAISMLVVAPIWAVVANRISKRNAWMVASCFGFAGLAALYVIPPGHEYSTLGLFFLIGIGTTGFSVLFWSMVPDAVEVNEHMFGDRYEAKTISLAMFSRKFTLAINALLIGAVLELTGYTPSGPVTPETVSGLRALIAFIPLTCIIISVLALWNYRLDAAEHQRLRELNAQRVG